MQDIFREIKSKLDIKSVAQTYGINVINGKNARCCFHDDMHPSMSFKENICTCWVCNKTFDCISLTSALYNLPPIESVKKLNQDFGVNLDIGKPVNKEYIRQINKENELLDKFDIWEKQAFIILADYLHLLKKWKQQYVPTQKEFERVNINPKYVEACHKSDYIEYLTEFYFMNKDII